MRINPDLCPALRDPYAAGKETWCMDPDFRRDDNRGRKN